MNKIYIHIDQLILEGLDPQAQRDYVDGLQQGLRSLIAKQMTVSQWKNTGYKKSLKLNSHTLGDQSSSKSQGIETAHSIVSGITSCPLSSTGNKGK